MCYRPYVFCINSSGVDFSGFLGLLYVHQAGSKIDLNDFANFFLFGAQVFAGAEISFLFLKGIAIRGYLSLNAQPFNERKPRETRAFVEEFLIGQRTEPVIFPVFRLHFAPMPVEEMGKKPSRGLFRIAFSRVSRETVTKGCTKRSCALLALIKHGWRRSI